MNDAKITVWEVEEKCGQQQLKEKLLKELSEVPEDLIGELMTFLPSYDYSQGLKKGRELALVPSLQEMMISSWYGRAFIMGSFALLGSSFWWWFSSSS